MGLSVTMMTLLSKLEKYWSDEYMLFADNGTLLLVRRKDGLIVKAFPRIICDGGEPDHEYCDGETYILQV
jgi:hypothetical protein